MKAKTFNQFINERFEEMDRPNFFQRAKKKISRAFSGGDSQFGKENPFSTIDGIIAAIMRGDAKLKVNVPAGSAGGWLEIGGRSRSFLLDIDEGSIMYDGRKLDLPADQAMRLWAVITDRA